MKLTISNEETSELIPVDLPGSLTLQDFKAYLETETNISPADQIIRHNGKTIQDSTKPLEELGLAEDDLLVVLKLRSTSAESSAPNANPTSSDLSAIDSQAEMLRAQFLSNPSMNNSLRQSNPALHAQINNPAGFKQAMLDAVQQFRSGDDQSSAQQEELRRLEQNPDDPANQERILELIRQEQVNENMQLAYDISPESFAQVTMLFINIKVNGHKVQAFVDSGAQTTIISPRLAEKVGIDRLLDRRFQGQAVGVGSQKMEGKIHSVPISIDMLRRHRCVIDLQKDSLIVAGQIETKFLPELEIKFDPSGGMNSGGKGQKLGGNIFSDGADVPLGNTLAANSTPTPSEGGSKNSRTATNPSAQAALKRQNTGSTQPKFKKEDIQQLTSLGFSEQEAVFALEQCKGNVEMAASLLFQ
ncbi:hypothetical protein QCA50_012200 [Cerrena zonata]|uniref:DNA damage-inducible protein 1 n=1 Tax=Cerrena zonata TaxID=2478898 RepID=A0AAW0FZT4_9APHY